MGYIYDVSKNMDEIGYLGAEDFYEYLGEFGANYVVDVEDDDGAMLVDDLLESFKKIGCEVGCETVDKDEDENPVYTYCYDGPYRYFILTDEAKKSYFNNSLQRLKALVEQATIEDFALDTMLAYDISMLADDRYEDRVYNGYAKTMDAFIREADSGEKYYISNNVVRIHNYVI